MLTTFLLSLLHLWVPLIIGFYLLAKTKADVNAWANTLVNNHMTHIEAATERMATAMESLAEGHKTVMEQQTTFFKDVVDNLKA